MTKNNDKIFTTGQAAKYLDLNIKTLQRWDREGRVKAHRNQVSNRRYYYQSELDEILGKSALEKEKRKIVAYGRVSSNGQKDDLKDQMDYLRQFINARGIIADEYIADIGSGLNYKRPKWLKLLKEIDQNKVECVYVTYQDRFIRLGYEFFERFCSWHNCEIVVLNNENTSPSKELVDDLVSIIHVFSCRLYGLRRYKNKIKNDPNLK
ncbi:IS607 family transposase [Lactobacillus acidophilus]